MVGVYSCDPDNFNKLSWRRQRLLPDERPAFNRPYLPVIVKGGIWIKMADLIWSLLIICGPSIETVPSLNAVALYSLSRPSNSNRVIIDQATGGVDFRVSTSALVKQRRARLCSNSPISNLF